MDVFSVLMRRVSGAGEPSRIVACILIILAASGAALFAADPEPFGRFSLVEGEIGCIRNMVKNQVKVGDSVFSLDKITTGDNSRAEIRISNGNDISVSAKTIFVVDAKKADNKLLLNLDAGKVRCKLDNLKGETFSVKTPVAVVGVRGTDFVTGYDPAAGNANALSVTVIQGSVNVSSALDQVTSAVQSVVVQQNQRVEVSSQGAVQPVVTVPAVEIQKIQEEHPVEAKPLPPVEEKKAAQEEKKEEKKEAKEEKKEAGKDKKEGDAKDKKEGDAKDKKEGDAKDKKEGDAKDKKEGDAKDKKEGETTKEGKGEAKKEEEKKDGAKGEDGEKKEKDGAAKEEGRAPSRPIAKDESKAAPAGEAAKTDGVAGEAVKTDEVGGEATKTDGVGGEAVKTDDVGAISAAELDSAFAQFETGTISGLPGSGSADAGAGTEILEAAIPDINEITEQVNQAVDQSSQQAINDIITDIQKTEEFIRLRLDFTIRHRR